ncbi:N-acetylated-alpha-linked acidic dipeptidase [Filimonas lacunae]|uniref:N-acetylated-alpha-linked acidic dipeptidase n=1 Tax=Filimonas lacunae TaxID=477680 RepID=A0A173MR03_9BACT|nr:transferrin receptor-like dimerization domain-containing protein [Filimonas lacunae]BAV09768.1 glutamate carboxypeptidase II precursor [Filimonas lacunae]SIS78719.1 N-acetylated-alpha-linked acidic dipeptidase [Filimonas lacunae]
MKPTIVTGAMAGLLLMSSAALAQSNTKPLAGFTEKASQTQLQNEARFDQLISADNIGKTIYEFSARPHHIGSAAGKAVAGKVAARFKEYGFTVNIETFQVLFPTPKVRELELTYPTKYKAVLKELAVKEDPSSSQEGQLPTYNAWGADGDVNGELVFVNYGLPSDYEQLEKLGIDVNGKIVIAKYGRSWRGIKPKIAQEHGAIGCIIYSDPKDDGYYQGEVYPKGAFKNEYGVQRGSVMDMVVYPGDPLTPNIASTENAPRLERSKAANLLKIPVLPISYHDAKPLLEALGGPVAPEDWRGALPITYHVGPGSAKVHLHVECEWKQTPCYDVIATMQGEAYPDEWVIRGNHHDAWVNGAADPVSGLAALLEEAKAIGQLVKQGWKPQRTLVYCAWDGEEPGLMGSTEWVEAHADELEQKAVIYINTDGNGRGFLQAGGSHALEPLMDDIAKAVIDPQTKVSVYERRKANDIIKASTLIARKDALAKRSLSLSALGSGSDYTSFLQHVGVPSLNLEFGGEDDGGEYHSIYDSYSNYVRFKDSGFLYGAALAQTAGRVALRMANAEILPFNFRTLYTTVNGYVTDLMSQVEQMREATNVENQILRGRAYKLAADPKTLSIAPKPKEELPYMDFSPLQNAMQDFDKVTRLAGDSLSRFLLTTNDHGPINKLLFQAEQQLMNPKGLPSRPWFKHTLYAPGFYTGYGVKTMPGIREAIEQRKWNQAQEQINLAADAIRQLADHLYLLAKLAG